MKTNKKTVKALDAKQLVRVQGGYTTPTDPFRKPIRQLADNE